MSLALQKSPLLSLILLLLLLKRENNYCIFTIYMCHVWEGISHARNYGLLIFCLLDRLHLLPLMPFSKSSLGSKEMGSLSSQTQTDNYSKHFLITRKMGMHSTRIEVNVHYACTVFIDINKDKIQDKCVHMRIL